MTEFNTIEFDEITKNYTIPEKCKVKYGSVKIFYEKGIVKPSKECIEFSLLQARDGNQVANRPGGERKRGPSEMFCNTLQGKFAEEIRRYNAIQQNLLCSLVDYTRTPLGKGDDGDLIVDNIPEQIKSVPFFSNLMLIECKSIQWILNKYHRLVLVRIFPCIKKIVLENLNINDNNFKNKFDILRKTINDTKWSADIVGYITTENLKKIVASNHTIKKWYTLQKSTVIDADNYYVAASDLAK